VDRQIRLPAGPGNAARERAVGGVTDRPAAMGRGLAAILAVGPRDEPEELRQLPIDLIDPNPRQPRRQLEDDALARLADSIRIRGQIQPILVRPAPGGRYELIAGERRWRACQLAEQSTFLAMVRRHDDGASLELALVENMVREDLNPIDEARACAALVEELGLTREEVGLRVGRSRVAISNLLRLLDLPAEVMALLESGALSEGHGRALLQAPEDADRRRLARRAVDGGWSVRDLERRARPSAAVPRRRAVVQPPDEEAVLAQEAARQISSVLGEALGTDVRVEFAGGDYVAQMRFGSPDEALDLARRLRLHRAV
jgi:ParB family transcriptional regulator, chromosome partitioning protein